MPSTDEACATTGRPLLLAASTMRLISSRVKPGPRFAVRAPAIVRVDLDEVDTARDLAARHAHHAVEAVGFFRALRHGELRRESLRRVAAGNDHGRTRHQHARAGHHAFVDRLAQTDVGIGGALAAEVAHGRHPGHQGGARVVDAAGDAQRQRLAQHLVVPARLVVGMQQQVRVSLDQAGHQRRALSAMVRAPGGSGDRGGRTSRLDALAADHHDPAGVRRLAVEHAIGLQDERRGRRLLRRRSQLQGQDEKRDNPKSHGCLNSLSHRRPKGAGGAV